MQIVPNGCQILFSGGKIKMSSAENVAQSGNIKLLNYCFLKSFNNEDLLRRFKALHAVCKFQQTTF